MTSARAYIFLFKATPGTYIIFGNGAKGRWDYKGGWDSAFVVGIATPLFLPRAGRGETGLGIRIGQGFCPFFPPVWTQTTPSCCLLLQKYLCSMLLSFCQSSFSNWGWVQKCRGRAVTTLHK